MAVNAIVQDGEIIKTAAQKSAETPTKSAPDGYDKDAFLQLLVAQMKYQDPLEPTDNSQYITQYATFSQVESLQNMAANMDLSRASSMVGQTVEISTTDDNGKQNVIKGVVDYVTYEAGKAFVSVNGESYSVSDVARIIDESYDSATELADKFAAGMEKLPTLNNLTIADRNAVTELMNLYSNMGSYAQSFVNTDYAKLLEAYVDRMAELVAAVEASNSAEGANPQTTEDQTGTQAVETVSGTSTGGSQNNTDESVREDESGETVDGNNI